MTDNERYDVWREVDKEFLRNTADDMVEDYFDGMCHEDILGELGYKAWDEMLADLATRFEKEQDSNVAENDTWRSVIEWRMQEAMEAAKAKPEEEKRQLMRNVFWITWAYKAYADVCNKYPAFTMDEAETMILDMAKDYEKASKDSALDYSMSITGYATERFRAEAQKRNPIKEGDPVMVAGEGKPLTDLDWVLDNVTEREQLKRWIRAVIDEPERYYRLFTVREIIGDKALCKPVNGDPIVLDLKDLRVTSAKGDE